MAEASSLNSSLIEELTDGLETDLQVYQISKIYQRIYKLTTTKKPFLASPIDKISQYLLLSSFIGLSILCNSEKWWCDGTFKTAPKFFYQHYIIHGKYKNKYPLPGMFSFMAGKSYDLYSLMLIQLKEAAQIARLTLAPKIIHCDFEKGAIKAFKMHFFLKLLRSDQEHFIVVMKLCLNLRHGFECVWLFRF